MTYRELITKVVAQIESAIQTGDPDTIQMALLLITGISDLDDGSADDLLARAFVMMQNCDDKITEMIALQEQ